MELFTEKNYELFLGDALDEMNNVPNESVDLICVDLPYQITQNKWDTLLPFDLLWNHFKRIKKKNSAVVLTASQPFTSMLVMSNLEEFKYEIIWEKTIGSGQLNIGHQPLRIHESILVFYEKIPTYNEQLTVGEPYNIKRSGKYTNENYGVQKSSEKHNEGTRHARSVIKISNPRIKGGHPTQKPLDLMSYIIRTYSNEHDIILDCCMGHGTTGISCGLNQRKFIGIEKDNVYFDEAKKKIDNAYIFY